MIRLIRKIKWFIQRGIRGWADSDTWDFHCYLADIITGGTKYLLENQHGYPGSLTEKEWDQKLKEMIWAFEYYRDYSDIWYQDVCRVDSTQADKNKEINEKRAKEGLKIFIEHFRDLWD